MALVNHYYFEPVDGPLCGEGWAAPPASWAGVSCPDCLRYGPPEPSRNDLETPGSTEVGPSATEGAEAPQNRVVDDPVHAPAHYRKFPIEVIEITELLSFTLGNVVKYVLRADYKGKPLEDLKKARWYLDREIARRERDTPEA